MEVTSIAAQADLAAQSSQARAGNDVQIAVLKKALDLDAQGAIQLIDAAAQAGRANPPHLGNRIDTFA